MQICDNIDKIFNFMCDKSDRRFQLEGCTKRHLSPMIDLYKKYINIDKLQFMQLPPSSRSGRKYALTHFIAIYIISHPRPRFRITINSSRRMGKVIKKHIKNDIFKDFKIFSNEYIHSKFKSIRFIKCYNTFSYIYTPDMAGNTYSDKEKYELKYNNGNNEIKIEIFNSDLPTFRLKYLVLNKFENKIKESTLPKLLKIVPSYHEEITLHNNYINYLTSKIKIKKRKINLI